MDKYAYLDEERQKLWERVTELEKLIKKKTPELVSEIAQYSKKASEYRNRCAETNERAKEYEKELIGCKKNIEAISSELQALNDEVIPFIESIKEEYSFIEEHSAVHKSNASTLESLYDNLDKYQSYLNELDSIVAEGNETSAKITLTHKKIINFYTALQEVYLKVFGSREEDLDGNEIVVKGLVAELEDSYSNIDNQLLNLSKKIDDTIKDAKEKLASTIEGFENTYIATHKKIESLLPTALTAGLSHAYQAKREAEVNEEKIHTKRFTRAIWGLVGVSSIIFAVSIFQLFSGVALHDVILQMPRVVLAIMPLYIPVLWFAYSSGKKRNLSKRLIEEYTHKEVISKTFEGLSTQIINIDDSSISNDLKVKLLYNVLEVTSSNPGKLISDYDKSDHPFMEALDQSVKLSRIVDRIAQMPGIGKMTEILSNRAEKIITQKTEEVNAGLDIIDNKDE